MCKEDLSDNPEKGASSLSRHPLGLKWLRATVLTLKRRCLEPKAMRRFDLPKLSFYVLIPMDLLSASLSPHFLLPLIFPEPPLPFSQAGSMLLLSSSQAHLIIPFMSAAGNVFAPLRPN